VSDETQVFADMAIHSLESALDDLERLIQTPAERAMIRAEYLRVDDCYTRLFSLLLKIKQKVAA
jgi:hypothetical protein